MRSTMEVTPEIIDCWRINYGLDKTPHELHEFWNDRVPSGAVMALKVACDEIESLRKDADLLAWILTHPGIAAEELEDAAAGEGMARSNIEKRRAAIAAHFGAA